MSPSDDYVRFPRVAATMAALWFAALGVTVATGRMPSWVLAMSAVVSAITYLAYRSDKRRAQKSERRIPEQTLHLLSLLGGWPGALVAQWRLRHKNRKLAFQTAFWLVIAVNVAMVYALSRR